MTHEKLIDRVKKLLALATSSNEAEAQAAANKAHALLAEHKLTLADLPDDEHTADPIDQLNTSSSGNGPWIRAIWHGAARLNFCGYFFNKNGRRTDHHIVGTQGDALSSQAMSEYLTNTVKRLAREAKKEHGGDGPFENSFRTACGLRISRRLHERRAELEQGRDTQNTIANAGNLPAVYASNDKAIEEFQEKNNPSMKSSKIRPRMNDAMGAALGRAAGDKIGIDRQLSSSSSATLQLGHG